MPQALPTPLLNSQWAKELLHPARVHCLLHATNCTAAYALQQALALELN